MHLMNFILPFSDHHVHKTSFFKQFHSHLKFVDKTTGTTGTQKSPIIITQPKKSTISQQPFIGHHCEFRQTIPQTHTCTTCTRIILEYCILCTALQLHILYLWEIGSIIERTQERAGTQAVQIFLFCKKMHTESAKRERESHKKKASRRTHTHTDNRPHKHGKHMQIINLLIIRTHMYKRRFKFRRTNNN